MSAAVFVLVFVAVAVLCWRIADWRGDVAEYLVRRQVDAFFAELERRIDHAG